MDGPYKDGSVNHSWVPESSGAACGPTEGMGTMTFVATHTRDVSWRLFRSVLRVDSIHHLNLNEAREAQRGFYGKFNLAIYRLQPGHF